VCVCVSFFLLHESSERETAEKKRGEEEEERNEPFLHPKMATGRAHTHNTHAHTNFDLKRGHTDRKRKKPPFLFWSQAMSRGTRERALKTRSDGFIIFAL